MLLASAGVRRSDLQHTAAGGGAVSIASCIAPTAVDAAVRLAHAVPALGTYMGALDAAASLFGQQLISVS